MTPSFWWQTPLAPAAKLLRPTAWLYATLATLHGTYRRTRAYYAAVPVVSVGNITLGGAGKTPVTIWLAEYFASQNAQVAIVSRGYKGTQTAEPQQVDPATHTAAQVGDEPLLMARHFEGKPVTIWVGKNRPAAVRRAEQSGADIILLDDGFQRQDVARTIDIVVINGTNPFGNNLPLPAGPLREFPSALKRASFAIVLDEPAAQANTYYGIPAYRLQTTPLPASLKGITGPVLSFSGLAHPQKFFTTLRTNGIQVVDEIAFPDHHPYPKSDLALLQAKSQQLRAQLVTTTKDAVKLPPNFAHALQTTLTGPDVQNIIEELELRLK